jgi:hypothetical protein
MRTLCVFAMATCAAFSAVPGFAVRHPPVSGVPSFAARSPVSRVRAQFGEFAGEVDACLNDEGCDVDYAGKLLAELEQEQAERTEKISRLASYLQYLNTGPPGPDRAATSPTDAAQFCLESGCPIDYVEDLVADLRMWSSALRANSQNHFYVDQLAGKLQTNLARAAGGTRTNAQL